ncbi:MAG TPA: hypothetical protein VM238_18525 [Phycisphaerae bacterium]|nr:hypothetical protein [Phycisphaerae bacterium]
MDWSLADECKHGLRIEYAYRQVRWHCTEHRLSSWPGCFCRDHCFSFALCEKTKLSGHCVDFQAKEAV